jgi:hypothetical protein
MHKRKYATLRIPESLAAKKHAQLHR